MWFNQILTLEEDYGIITPDAYTLPDVVDLDMVCDLLVRSLDAEGIERATVVGISAGGGVAQGLLQRHPERVEHVVLSHCDVLEHSAEGERTTRRILWLVRLLPMIVIRRVLKRMTAGDPTLQPLDRLSRGLHARGDPQHRQGDVRALPAQQPGGAARAHVRA